jgi:hypothetical protein
MPYEVGAQLITSGPQRLRSASHSRPSAGAVWPVAATSAPQPLQVRARDCTEIRVTHRISVMDQPPTRRNVRCGVNIRCIADARSSSAADPDDHLDVAPDRRLAHLKLGGANRAALTQCPEFGQ